jgi:hypothetical protein
MQATTSSTTSNGVTQRDLLRALVLYARLHPDRRFRRRAKRLNASVYADVQRLLLSKRLGTRQADPERAVAFAISTIAAMLQERILFDDVTALPPASRDVLIGEAARMIKCYLCGSTTRRQRS